MADEWSKPVKDEEGDWRSETVGAPVGHYHDALLRDGYIGEGMDRQTAIPAHVALRLLAAEASDRLGWVWEVRRDNDGKAKSASPGSWVEWRRDGHVTVESDFNSDELLACQHGRFLLADALREAGQ